MYELFVSQLAPPAAVCTLCGKRMNGLNCTCAAMAAWLFRASQGRIKLTACAVRDMTDDCEGGTNLGQMAKIAEHFGIKYTPYQPGLTKKVFDLVDTGRYGAIFDINYAAFVGTPYDRFAGRFRGNHAIYLGKPGHWYSSLSVDDPGSRDGYHDVPKTLLASAAGRLDFGGGETVNSNYGGGHCYAMLTPADPPTDYTPYHFLIGGTVNVYDKPEGTVLRKLASGSGSARRRTVNGHLWLYVVKPGSPVDGKWLHAGPNISVRPI